MLYLLKIRNQIIYFLCLTSSLHFRVPFGLLGLGELGTTITKALINYHSTDFYMYFLEFTLLFVLWIGNDFLQTRMIGDLTYEHIGKLLMIRTSNVPLITIKTDKTYS